MESHLPVTATRPTWAVGSSGDGGGDDGGAGGRHHGGAAVVGAAHVPDAGRIGLYARVPRAGADPRARDGAAELEDKSRRGEEVDRLKSVFIANMSHEIRTPLNSVLALSQLLRDGVAGPLTVDQRQYLEVIERNGQNLLRLINDILDLSRIEAGHLEMDTQNVDLAPHVAAIAGELAPLAMAKELDLVEAPRDAPGRPVRHRPGPPDPDQPDRQRDQVHRRGDGPGDRRGHRRRAGRVGERHRRRDPRADLDRIFHEFFQVDQTLARRQGGTGLGLAIASRLARLMGGEIPVTSVVGAGRGSR